jgi:hypothetical protein
MEMMFTHLVEGNIGKSYRIAWEEKEVIRKCTIAVIKKGTPGAPRDQKEQKKSPNYCQYVSPLFRHKRIIVPQTPSNNAAFVANPAEVNMRLVTGTCYAPFFFNRHCGVSFTFGFTKFIGYSPRRICTACSDVCWRMMA